MVAVLLVLSMGSLPRERLQLLFGAACIPHPLKEHKGGEDAYFADHAVCAFGLADGVGGSATADVDPGVFSRRLLRTCHAQMGDETTLLSAVLSTASLFAAEEESPAGSSTLLLGHLHSTGMLHLLNIGDSAVLVLRKVL